MTNFMGSNVWYFFGLAPNFIHHLPVLVPGQEKNLSYLEVSQICPWISSSGLAIIITLWLPFKSMPSSISVLVA